MQGTSGCQGTGQALRMRDVELELVPPAGFQSNLPLGSLIVHEPARPWCPFRASPVLGSVSQDEECAGKPAVVCMGVPHNPQLKAKFPGCHLWEVCGPLGREPHGRSLGLQGLP